MASEAKRSGAVAVAAALLLAGCLGGSDDALTTGDDVALAVPDDWWLTSIPSSLTDEKHNHGNRTEHLDLTTANFHVAGWDPLVTEAYGTTLVGMGCGGAADRADGRRLAVVHSIATDVSFVVADVMDPAAPMMLGEFYMPNAVVWDADITADGMNVLVGAYPYFIFDLTNPAAYVPTLPPVGGGAVDSPDLSGTISFAGNHAAERSAADLPPPIADAAMPIFYRSACTGTISEVTPVNYLPYGPGIVMVSIADPANPELADWRNQPAVGPHTVSSALIDGVLWATASVTNLNREGSYYSLFNVIDTPAGAKLQQVGHIEAPGINSRVPPAVNPDDPVGIAFNFLTNGHIDVYISKHLGDGKTYGYLANAYGMYVYDLSGPVPMQVGVWHDEVHPGGLHTTYTFPEMWGDKVYMIAAEEVGEPVELPSGYAYILDITDPTKPTEVSRWTLPIKPKWDDGGLMFSPHYVAVMNHTMLVSNYHGGLWAVDISDPTMPMASGLFVPDRESPSTFGGAAQYGPSIEDVIVHPDGVITTWDGAGGVYNLHFIESVPGALAPPWGSDEAAAHEDMHR
jgi:hypothetical protein